MSDSQSEIVRYVPAGDPLAHAIELTPRETLIVGAINQKVAARQVITRLGSATTVS